MIATRPRWLALRLRRMQDRLSAALAARLRRYFAGQAGRVVEKHDAGYSAVEILVPREELWALYRTLEPSLRQAIVATAELTAPVAGAPALVDTDWRVQALLADSATRVVGITEQTRRAIRTTLLTGSERHYSPWQIAHGVPGEGFRGLREVVVETYRNRAETISRTEIALASAGSAMDRYGDGGVTEVDILDGPECGWHTHDDPDKADGTRRFLFDYREHLLSHPNCLVGSSMVLAPDTTAAFARWFEGEVLVVRAAADDLLTCTPEHPVLTDLGWLPAHLVEEGRYVIRRGWAEWRDRFGPDEDEMPTTIEQKARAFGVAGAVVPARMPVPSVDLDGDGLGRDVDVVGTGRFGQYGRDPAICQPLGESALGYADVRLGSFLTKRPLLDLVDRAFDATNSVVCGAGDPGALLDRHCRHSVFHRLAHGAQRPAESSEAGAQIPVVHANRHGDSGRGLAGQVALVQGMKALFRSQARGSVASTDRDAEPVESQAERLPVDADDGRDLFVALARFVQPTRVSQVLRRPFRGHVYNLETQRGWYIAGGIVVHNCRRVALPVLESRR